MQSFSTSSPAMRKTSVSTTATAKAPTKEKHNERSRVRIGSSSSFTLPRLPLKHYFTRRHSSKLRTNDLPMEEGAIGSWSAWGAINFCVFATVPLAYIYILLILVRETCHTFPHTLLGPLERQAQQHLPSYLLARLVAFMETHSSTFVEAWCVIEAIFYVVLKLQIQYLQSLDPLEASLSSAPMMDPVERSALFTRIMEAESDSSPIAFICGWFFDSPQEEISRYDVRDFLTWSLFESRNQEHLTPDEVDQLDSFVEDLEYRISVHMYGLASEEEKETEASGESIGGPSKSGMTGRTRASRPIADDEGMDDLDFSLDRPKPRRTFRFPENTDDKEANFFTDLYENYKRRYEQYRNMIGNAEFHPVQDFRNFMIEAEENAMATATQMYEVAYKTMVSPGSSMDKQLIAMKHATEMQLTEAWNSVKGIKERLETAEFLSGQRKRIQQQLKGYRLLLSQMVATSSAVPSQQMAHLMRKITDCNEAMEGVERRAMDAFGNATGFARRNFPRLSLPSTEPVRCAKYNSDPLLGIATYPLGFHLFILGATDLPLRIMFHNRGLRRLRVGRVTYWYHPGQAQGNSDDDDDTGDRLPIVFVHGIGVGLVMYVPLIDHLLKSGRPILLPEIPYVSGFRPWQSPNAVLSPAVVSNTMTDMLATHGYLRGTFVGHSYGTSWLSYMVKYAPQAIAAACFLDPICFCLYNPRLTKQFVYVRPDPGTISYMVRTDVIVNWTIQRSFPWAWISLFTEQIHVPCSVFLSSDDMLVPAAKVEEYLRGKGVPSVDFAEVTRDHFEKGDINLTVFRGSVHGGWTEKPTETSPKIAECIDILTTRAEELKES